MAVAALLWIAAAGLVAAIWLRHFLYTARKSLPPGSMGWPLLGETLQFLSSRPSFTSQPFINKRLSRFGSIFKTHLFGQPLIVSADAELNKLIFHNRNSAFDGSYPFTAHSHVIGRNSIVELQGEEHQKVHDKASQLMSLEALNREEFDAIQTYLAKRFSAWQDQIVTVQHEAMSIALGLLLNKLTNLDPEMSVELEDSFEAVRAFLAFPFNVPCLGSSDYKKGHKQLIHFFEDKIAERKQNRQLMPNDLLGYLLSKKNGQERSSVCPGLILANIMGFLFHGQETTAMALTLIVKLLSEHPRALSQLREENLHIRRAKAVNDKLSWDDYNSMTFTQCVIKEGLRIASVVPWVFRNAVEDVAVKGFIIPKGWRVMAFLGAAHFDSTVFQDPHCFNPWRWEDKSLNASLFTPFGEGERLCPGAELATVIIALSLHYLITTYSWQVVLEDEVIRFPVLMLQQGFPIAVKHLQDEDECLILH